MQFLFFFEISVLIWWGRVVVTCRLVGNFAGCERGNHWLDFGGRSLSKRQRMIFSVRMYRHLISEPYQTVYMPMKSLE